MKKQLFLLIALLSQISVFGQIKTTEVEVRAATDNLINVINGPTSVTSTLDVNDLPGSFFQILPKISMTSDATNYERGLRVKMTDAYGIPSGVSDGGYRIGIDLNMHAGNSNFQGFLQRQTGMRLQFGANSAEPTGTFDEVIGLRLTGLTGSGVTINKAHGIYQTGGIYKNYFEANVGIGSNDDPQALLQLESDVNDMSRLLIDLKGASNNTGIELKANSIASGSNWISATGDLESDGFVIKGDGFMGLGTNSPQGRLHISSSSVGGNFNSNYDDLVIEHAGEHMGITLKASGTYRSGIAFSDEADGNSGRFFYDHNNNSMAFHTNDGERMRILDNGSVGIGTSSPSAKLHIHSSSTGKTAHSNFNNLVVEEDGANIGMTFLASNNQNAGIAFSDGDATNQGLLIYHHADDRMTLYTGGTEKMRVLANGNIGIGTTTPSEKLHIDGNVLAVNFNNSSDRRWKKDISEINDVRKTLNAIHPVSYEWRVKEFPNKDFDHKTHYGVIAQELEEVLPELVSTDNEGYKSVDYLGMIGLLVKGFQERGAEIERLKMELSGETAANQTAIATLESRLARLEALLTEKENESNGSLPTGRE